MNQPTANRIIRYILPCILGLSLTACGQQAPESGCAYIGENLLLDTGFTTLDSPRFERKWQSSEHGLGKSFSYSAKDGVLSIEQTGAEPWINVTQSIDTSALAGKRVEFSAHLKLDLAPSRAPHAFKLGGGLMLYARKNGKVVVRSTLEHEPHMGVHDWQTALIVVDLPQRIDFLQVGLLHQAGGAMQVRNPSLRVVNDECPLTPIEIAPR